VSVKKEMGRIDSEIAKRNPRHLQDYIIVKFTILVFGARRAYFEPALPKELPNSLPATSASLAGQRVNHSAKVS
jgi:hypothetical protein